MPCAINNSLVKSRPTWDRTRAGAARLFTTARTRTYLGTLGGDVSEPWDFNATGHVVGDSQSVPGNGDLTHGFLYNGSTMIDLGGGSGVTVAYGINDADDVVGETNGVAFLYQGAGLINLNTLIRPFPAGRCKPRGTSTTTAKSLGYRQLQVRMMRSCSTQCRSRARLCWQRSGDCGPLVGEAEVPTGQLKCPAPEKEKGETVGFW